MTRVRAKVQAELAETIKRRCRSGEAWKMLQRTASAPEYVHVSWPVTTSINRSADMARGQCHRSRQRPRGAERSTVRLPDAEVAAQPVHGCVTRCRQVEAGLVGR